MKCRKENNNKPLKQLELTTTLFFLHVFIEYEYLA